MCPRNDQCNSRSPSSLDHTRESDQEDDLLTASPFEQTGPFEIKLAPGDHTLTIATGDADAGAVPVTIKWNDHRLLTTSFISSEVTGTGRTNVSAQKQIDYPPKRDLPWLLTVQMNVNDPNTGSRKPQTHAFSVWLSDQSSDFARFPTP